MKPVTYLSEDELVDRAIEALTRELGPVETARFLTLPPPATGDSVRRHREWQATLDKDAFFDQVFGAPKDASRRASK